MKSKGKTRRYCTCCNTKQYTETMRLVYYKLLKKSFWHCFKCLSATQDNLHFLPAQKNRYFIELYSGSKTISTVAQDQFAYSTFTVDIEEKYKPGLCIDMAKIRLNQIPDSKRAFIVWASLPCTYYTILNVADHWQKLVYSHRQYYYIPKTKQAKQAIQLLEKTLWLIKGMNPVYWFIENPRGALRHMPQMNFAPYRYTVSYNDYGSAVYKPTDIFTNCGFLKLKEIKTAVGRKFENSILEMGNSFERSIVPPALIQEILQQIDAAHDYKPITCESKSKPKFAFNDFLSASIDS